MPDTMERRAGDMSSEVMLRATRLRVSFGGLLAVDGFSLAVPGGQVTALVGPNGAGKSTVLNVLSGFYRSEGSITLSIDGEQTSFDDKDAKQRARLGIGRTFQTPRLLPQLTVWENVVVADAWTGGLQRWTELVKPRSSSRALRRRRESALAFLEPFDLQDKSDLSPDHLSLGQQRMLEIARALYGSSKLMLLDEPFAGLSQGAGQLLGNTIERVASRGTGILLIEHNLEVVRRLSRHIVVMHEGKELCAGAADDVLADQRVVDAFLGPEMVLE